MVLQNIRPLILIIIIKEAKRDCEKHILNDVIEKIATK